MISIDEVKKLAELARLTVPEEDLPRFTKEFDSILAYVGQLQRLDVSGHAPFLPYTNVFRKDGEPHEKGLWTEKIAALFPARDGDALSVKQIISHD